MKSHRFSTILSAHFATAVLFGCAVADSSAADPQVRAAAGGGLLVYVGTYTGAKSKGIYVYRMDPASGQLSPLGLAAQTVNPTFLAIDPNHRYLFAANETDRFQGQRSGSISAFKIDPTTGKLSLLSQKPSGGSGPCHLAVDKTGACVLVANYGSGSVAVLPIGRDGGVADPSCTIQHRGSSVNPSRQEGPHAHGVYLDGANRIALVADLGLDKIFAYQLNPAEHKLVPNSPPWQTTHPGAGPRHIAFHPNGRFVFVINEMGNTIVGYTYNAAQGSLTELQQVSTLPADFKGENTTAEIFVHPSGRFLYGSNRGHDSIVAYTVDADSGKITQVQDQPSMGKMPRNFGIDPSGSFLFAANQASDDIFVFRIAPETGRLTYTGQRIEVGAPVCILFD